MAIFNFARAAISLAEKRLYERRDCRKALLAGTGRPTCKTWSHCAPLGAVRAPRLAPKLRYYGDVVYSFYRKSAVEHDGGV